MYYEKLKQEKLEIEKNRQQKIKDEEEINRLQEEKRKGLLEEERKRKIEEERKRQTHKCGIMIMNMCICENPKYEFVKLSNNLFCVICNKWKCRCKS